MTPPPNFENQTIWTGDNLDIMRGMNSETIDLIYLDPPFNSNANYAAPIGSEAAGAAFKDTWGLSDIDLAWCELIQGKHPGIHNLLLAVKQIYGDSMMAYLIYMAPRLMEMKRLLKSTGTIYLHCDPTASHYLKIIMDDIFGSNNFRNEIVWRYGKMSNSPRNFAKNHDIILRYTKSENWIYNPIKMEESEYRTRFQRFIANNKIVYADVKHKNDKLIDMRVKKVEKKLNRQIQDSDVLFDFDIEFKEQDDVIYVSHIKGNSKEKTKYPTQKPVALLKRIIRASSESGDMVLDPFCGCATTCIAAEDLIREGHDRQWVGIDISPYAAKLVQTRMQKEMDFLTWKCMHRTDIPIRTDLGKIPKYNSLENKQSLYGKQGGHCNGCYTHFESRHLTIDHIVSSSKGGTDHIANLQLLCGNCNSIKGDKPHAYLANILQQRGFIDAVTQRLLQERDKLEPSKV